MVKTNTVSVSSHLPSVDFHYGLGPVEFPLSTWACQLVLLCWFCSNNHVVHGYIFPVMSCGNYLIAGALSLSLLQSFTGPLSLMCRCCIADTSVGVGNATGSFLVSVVVDP